MLKKNEDHQSLCYKTVNQTTDLFCSELEVEPALATYIEPETSTITGCGDDLAKAKVRITRLQNDRKSLRDRTRILLKEKGSVIEQKKVKYVLLFSHFQSPLYQNC